MPFFIAIGATGNSPMKREREIYFQRRKEKDIDFRPGIRRIMQNEESSSRHLRDDQPIIQENKSVGHHLVNEPIKQREVKPLRYLPDNRQTSHDERLVDIDEQHEDIVDVATPSWTNSVPLDYDDPIDFIKHLRDTKVTMRERESE